jgi:hypothetical protein
MLDEFDALSEEGIAGIARIFRNIYLHRRDDPKPSAEKTYLLHGVALIGVRSVLGIENVTGSPTTHKEYQEALRQAAQYGKQLHLTEIALIVFVESIDKTNRKAYEMIYVDEATGVTVSPVFVETGS